MTDRLKGFTVVLEQDMRDDDAEVIKRAILALRFVEAVVPIETVPEDYFSRTRIRRELIDKLFKALEEDK